MYCPGCGSEIKIGEKFCMHCGNPIDEKRKIVAQKPTHVSSISQQRSSRIESANEVARMIEYFSPMQPQYDEYDQCSEIIDNCTRKLKIAPVVIGIILCAWGYLPIIAVLSVFGISGIARFGLEEHLVFCLPALLGTLVIVLRIIEVINRKKKLNQSIERQILLAKELTDYYNNYGELCLVGAEFSNPRILELIGNTLRQGRADTIKEAINVLLDDAHKTRMELQAELTAQSARQAASGATAAAVFSAARLFL